MTESQAKTNPTETINRPPVVSMTQIVFVAYTLIAIVWLVRRFLWLVTNYPLGLIPSIIGLFVLASMVIAIAVAFWGLMKKKQWGRWLAILVLLLLWVSALFSQLYPSANAYKFHNEEQRIGGLIGMAFVHLFVATLVFRLAFAKKVTRFFQS